jgi:hypothetical protein
MGVGAVQAAPNPFAEAVPCWHDAVVSASSNPAIDDYECLVASLTGQTIEAVDYCVLMAGADGMEPDDWDYGTWHEPTMGVELVTGGGVYSAIWGDVFDWHGLEVYSDPMSEHIGGVGDEGGTARVAVSSPAAWAGIIGEPIEAARILRWRDGRDDRRDPLPPAVHLRTAVGLVWIGAGRSVTYTPDGPFHLGTDDVFVVFGAEEAARVGLGVTEDLDGIPS